MLKKDINIGARYVVVDPEDMLNFCMEMTGGAYGAGDKAGLLDLFKSSDFECTAYNKKSHVVSLKPTSSMVNGVMSIDDVDMVGLFKVAPKNERNLDLEYEDVEKFIYSDQVIVCWLNSGEKGISRPKFGDEYDEKVGKYVAYLKAKKQKVRNKIEEEEDYLDFCIRMEKKYHDEIVRIEERNSKLCKQKNDIVLELQSL